LHQRTRHSRQPITDNEQSQIANWQSPRSGAFLKSTEFTNKQSMPSESTPDASEESVEAFARLLEMAASQNSFEILERLLDNQKASKAIKAMGGKDDFLKSLMVSRNPELLKKAFDAGLDPNTPTDQAGSSALMTAIDIEAHSLIPLLMERCEHAMVNEHGGSAFSAACYADSPDLKLIEALIPATLRAPVVAEGIECQEMLPPLATLANGCADLGLARKLFAASNVFAGSVNRNAVEHQCSTLTTNAERPESVIFFRAVIEEMRRVDEKRLREECEEPVANMRATEEHFLLHLKMAKAQKTGSPVPIGTMLLPLDELGGMGLIDEGQELHLLEFAKKLDLPMQRISARRERDALAQTVAEAAPRASTVSKGSTSAAEENLAARPKSTRL